MSNNFSTSQDKIGVTEIGLKSPSCCGMVTFGIKVTKAARHWRGPMPLVTEQLNVTYQISQFNRAGLKNQHGNPSEPRDVELTERSIRSTTTDDRSGAVRY
jgi:hypothetical protein